MVCKLFNEEGDYIVKSTGERVNLLCTTQAHTPEGLNVGWTQVSSEEEACQLWDLEYLKLEIENNG